MDSNVLVIATDRPASEVIARACRVLGAQVTRVEHDDEAIECLRERSIDLVVCGYSSFDRLSAEHDELHAVLVTDRVDSEQTIESMKRGALDCLVKPLREEDAARAIGQALQHGRDLRESKQRRPRQSDRVRVRLVGQSPAMQEVYKLIGLVAPSPINVLITGESGTGKELVARAIHEHSRRGDKAMLAVNCAAIPETLLESELFGHEKGAFTGASQRRAGKFEQANGGTLFLDEVGDIPLATQAKLLRVLQDHSFQRLGGSEVIQCDVRIVAATHQPLERLIEQKRFRQDLYYRLKVATIHVPPLREREVDAVLLAHHFIEKLHHELGTTVTHFAPEVVSALLSYAWPGNVRELENVVKAAAVVSRGPVLRLETMPPAIVSAARAGGRPFAAAADAALATNTSLDSPTSASDALDAYARALVADPTAKGETFAAAVKAMESSVIRAAIDASGGQLTRAAEMLGISRTTLRKKMLDMGIGVTSTSTPRTTVSPDSH